MPANIRTASQTERFYPHPLRAAGKTRQPGWADRSCLMESAKDKKNANIEYGPLISDLVARGVEFEVCELTLRALNLKRGTVGVGRRLHPVGRGAHRPTAVPRALRLYQSLSGAAAPVWRGL